jgi:hypothetical protein
MSPGSTSFYSPAKSHQYSVCRVFDDYYIEDCGVILAPEVTHRKTDNNDQFVILVTVGVAFVPACL